MSDLSKENRNDVMNNIYNLEDHILGMKDHYELDDMEYKHWFAPGLYGREITIPANMALTTMIHASEHIAIVSKGSLTVYSESGVEKIEAPYTMITKIGTKRAIYTHSETVFTTIHLNPDNEKDVKKLVSSLTFENEQDFLEYKKTLCIEESQV